jgi:hypothetical protein
LCSPRLRSRPATLAAGAFKEVQRILVEQEPVIYLVNPDSLSAIAPSLFPQALSNVESLSLQ